MSTVDHIAAARARLDAIAAERASLDAEEAKLRRMLTATNGRMIDTPAGSYVLRAAAAVAASAPAWTEFNGTILWALPDETAADAAARWRIDYDRRWIAAKEAKRE